MKFDFIKVFLGESVVDCRPVEWEGEDPSSFVTVCSSCDQMVQFPPTDVSEVRGVNYLECPHCHAPPPKEPEVHRSVPPIRDPIEVGNFVLPGAERLE